jgi:hypothetical protein
MVLLVLSTEIEAVQNLAVSWTWSLKFCKLLRQNRMLVADDLHQQGLHPCHLQRVQHLKPEDPPRRIAFRQWLLKKIDEEPNFLSIVVTTDEAGFTRDGVFNSHNTHIWSEENPEQIRERGFQQRFSINRLIGPHVLPQYFNCEEYFNFLQNVRSDPLDDMPLPVGRDEGYMTERPFIMQGMSKIATATNDQFSSGF